MSSLTSCTMLFLGMNYPAVFQNILSFSDNVSIGLVSKLFHQHQSNFIQYSRGMCVYHNTCTRSIVPFITIDEPSVIPEAYTGFRCDCCEKIPMELHTCNNRENQYYKKLCQNCIGDGIAGFQLNSGVCRFLKNIEGCICAYCDEEKLYTIKDFKDHIRICPNFLLRCHLCRKWITRNEYHTDHFKCCSVLQPHLDCVAEWSEHFQHSINYGATPREVRQMALTRYVSWRTMPLLRNNCLLSKYGDLMASCCVCLQVPEKVYTCNPNGHSICLLCALSIVPTNVNALNPFGDVKCPMCRVVQKHGFSYNSVLQQHNDEAVVMECPFCKTRMSWNALILHYYNCPKNETFCGCCSNLFGQKYEDWFCSNHIKQCATARIVHQFVPENMNNDFLKFLESLRQYSVKELPPIVYYHAQK